MSEKEDLQSKNLQSEQSVIRQSKQIQKLQEQIKSGQEESKVQKQVIGMVGGIKC